MRAFASARSAGSRLPLRRRASSSSRRRRRRRSAPAMSTCSSSRSARRRAASSCRSPPRAGAICVDKSSAYRLVDGYPLVVPEVNGRRALEALERDRIVANPNCCTIPLTCVLKPLHDEAGLQRVRVVHLPVGLGRRSPADGRARGRAAGRPRPRHGLDVGGRRVGRGGEAPRRDAQDHGAARSPDLRDLRARARHGRSLGGRLDRARASRSRPRTRPRCSASAPSIRVLDLPEFPTPAAAAGDRRGARRPHPARRRRPRTGSRSTSRATTSARAPR